MRMFRITVGGHSYSEPSNGRTPEEYQHHLATVEGMRFVHVKEWIRRGAKTPLPRVDILDED